MVPFYDPQMRKDYAYKFCSDNYRECQLYQLLNEYHKRKNDPRE